MEEERIKKRQGNRKVRNQAKELWVHTVEAWRLGTDRGLLTLAEPAFWCVEIEDRELCSAIPSFLMVSPPQG